MKKAFLFALAICCAFAAQAVTYAWSSYGDTNHSVEGKTYTLSLGNTVKTSSDIYYTQNTTTTGLASGNYAVNSLAFAIWAGGAWNSDDARNVALAIILDGKIAAVSSTTNRLWVNNGGTATSNTIFPSAGNKGYIEFIFDTSITLSTSETFSIAFLEANQTTNLVGATYDSSANYVYSVTNSDPGIVGKDNVLSFRTSVASVPEPTALALLALGVAGLALKRKVA